MIRELHIKGYKSIKDQKVQLTPINLLIGANGAGKTNFISIFSLIRNLYEKNLQEYIAVKGGSDSFFYMGKKVTERIEIDMYFAENGNPPHNRFDFRLIEAQDTLLIQSLGTAFFNNVWHLNTYEKNVKESNFKNLKHSQAYWVNQLLKDFEVYHFHDTSERASIKGKNRIDDNHVLRRDGGNIAAFLYMLKETENKSFLKIEKIVSSISPFFQGFYLEPDRLNCNLIQLQWKQAGMYDTYFNTYQLSDGTLRFICLATLLLQPNPPGTIIIDEPELGLHPMAINKLAELIKIASHKSQIIVSTQSTTLLDQFDANDIICINHYNNSTIFNRLKKEELSSWLEDYSLGEIWEKNVFGANF